MDRVLRQMRIGHMALYAAYGKGRAQGAAPAVLDHVTDQGGARRLADDAPVQALLACRQTLDHGLGAMMGRAFFVAGDQIGDLAPMIRVFGDETFSCNNHRRQAAFHIGGAAAAKHAVLVDQGIERVVLPGLDRAGRDHIGMTGKAQHRAIAFAVGRPEVVHIFDAHRLKLEADSAQALHHHGLTVSIQWSDRRTANQVAGELQGRREIGWGRHEQDSGGRIQSMKRRLS
jgi:hypothetical protein